MINSGGIWEALSQEVFSGGRDGEKYDTLMHTHTHTQALLLLPHTPANSAGLGCSHPLHSNHCVWYLSHPQYYPAASQCHPRSMCIHGVPDAPAPCAALGHSQSALAAAPALLCVPLGYQLVEAQNVGSGLGICICGLCGLATKAE